MSKRHKDCTNGKATPSSDQQLLAQRHNFGDRKESSVTGATQTETERSGPLFSKGPSRVRRLPQGRSERPMQVTAQLFAHPLLGHLTIIIREVRRMCANEVTPCIVHGYAIASIVRVDCELNTQHIASMVTMFEKTTACEAAMPHSSTQTVRPIGISFRAVNAFAFAATTDYQKTFGNFPLALIQRAVSYLRYRRHEQHERRVDILCDCEGLVKSGEMLLVLGRPGSGCSTLLRTIAGETKGFCVNKDAAFNYQGISAAEVQSHARGDCSYQSELDVHFPTLTTSETVMLSKEARSTPELDTGSIRKKSEQAATAKILEELGLSHVADTKVGNEEIPGISGGERKRLSIAEVLACSTSLQCWDNSTRGLDSAKSFQFIGAIRDRCNKSGTTALVSLYQASDDIFGLFNKVCILYEGHLVYFGPLRHAREYFERLGFVADTGQTEAEFLTSVTNPGRRSIRTECELSAPRTAIDMATRWKCSTERAELLRDIAQFEDNYQLNTIDGFSHQQYRASIGRQVSLCLGRGFVRLRNDLAPPISNLVGNCILGVVLGTVFLNLRDDTSSFFARSALIFFATLLNAFVSGFEPGMLWESRPIVEKHYRYALYQPISDSIASMITDLPNKFLFSITFNIPIYFLTNLRRTGSAFCTFWLFSFTCLLTMSMIFRTIGSWCSTFAGSMAPAALFMLLLMIYSGFPLPVLYMPPWLRWFNYLNPVAYTFESLMINEFSGRNFECDEFVPQGPSYGKSPVGKTCNVVGAQPGQPLVDGTRYISSNFSYEPSHLWRYVELLFYRSFANFPTGILLYCLPLWHLHVLSIYSVVTITR